MHLKTFTDPKLISSSTSPGRDSLSQADFDVLVARYKQAVYERSNHQNSLPPSPFCDSNQV